ncbi:MAG: CocE/NonD family hydrolase [Candidatus Dormibacteraeota bacterium]|nr:CocE/NonD family hydrolase [Candidatus Dormibacteraeota bacterium]
MRGCQIDLDVVMPMRDGVNLQANIYRPGEGGPFPTLLTRLPYGKDLALGTSVLDPVQVTRRGYAVVVQDTRGRFLSEGEFDPYRTEDGDGFDSIAWVAAQPWSDGKVGMYGASYFGQTQWAAAKLNPPALLAIAPHITWSEPLDGPLARDGAVELGLAASWGLQMVFADLVRRHPGDPMALGRALHSAIRDYDGLATGGYRELPLKGFPPLARHGVGGRVDLTLAALDDPAAAEHLRVRHEDVQVPALNGGGWYDIFLQGTIDNHNAMRRLGRPSRLVIGPWSHSTSINPVGEVNFGFGAQSILIDLRADFQSMQLRWFDHWLRGLDTGLMNEPAVKIFVMGVNRWRDLDEFPPSDSTPRDYFLHASGLLKLDPPAAGDAPDGFAYDPADPVPTRGGALLMTPEFRGGPYDQRDIEARPDVLVFTSDPLTALLEVTGQVSVILFASTTAPSTDFVGRLCDVRPDGQSINLTDGIVRVSGEPGTIQRHEIDLWATSNVFLPGHRIRLQITSSCFPRWDRNLNTGEPLGKGTTMAVARQTVFHDAAHPSALRLPTQPVA